MPLSLPLAARNIVAGYLPGISILQGVSVDAVRGQIRCVLGPNGTGKSTLLKVLYGFLPPSAGEVWVNGTRIHGVAPHEMGARGVVYLPQRPSIFPHLSVEVNLRLGAWREKGNRSRVRAYVQQAMEHFPMLAEKRRHTAGTLSGGQQRQLEIARSLMYNPTTFLVDEPTAGIEPRVATHIYRLIREIAARGKAILLVDQNIKQALEIADYAYVMRTGTIVSEGTREEFSGDTEALVARWLYASGKS
jgi:branched-chain amino acid transport system ATP-binding protein